ncbi:uncharacterized protein RSE6_11587 [Rhynchosporium secalis]|uniref:Uncharacterized protein n=1 Tax=Rhynchosporium secalis TaxID=38038 RepID=A0A1E1MND6_RHYSE|nr:uncharacterized protein RSE6_11587 [Rhynchosporium secalis]
MARANAVKLCLAVRDVLSVILNLFISDSFANNHSRLLLKCEYEYVASGLIPTRTVQSPSSRIETPTLPHLQATGILMVALSDRGPKSMNEESSIPTQVLNIILSHGQGFSTVTSTYFRTIDVWLPVTDAGNCI